MIHNKMKSIHFAFILWLFHNLFHHMVAQRILPPIDATDCGKTKGCFRSPGLCEADKCTFIVTWKMDEVGKTVDFEFSVHADHSHPWIALGFSNQTLMPHISVTDCIVNVSAANEIIIQSSYNPQYYNKVLSPNNKLGLISNRSEAEFVNGHLTCKFTRLVTTPSDKVADLSKPYYMFIAQGPAADDGVKLKHTVTPVISSRKILLSEIEDMHDGTLIVYHASFMIITWMFLSSIGIMLSRHYKNVWTLKVFDKKIWFQVHRVLMTCTFVLSAAGVIVIFLDLSTTPLLEQNIHPILGVIVLCLMTFNIALGIFHPSLGSSKRQLFNWTHSLIGNGTHLAAGLTMYFGVCALGVRTHIDSWLGWIIVAFGVWRVLIDIIMTVEKYYHREDLRVAYMEMSGSSDDIVIECTTLCFKKAMFGVYVVGLCGFTIATLYGTVSAFYD